MLTDLVRVGTDISSRTSIVGSEYPTRRIACVQANMSKGSWSAGLTLSATPQTLFTRCSLIRRIACQVDTPRKTVYCLVSDLFFHF